MLKLTTESIFSASEEKVWIHLPNPCSPSLLGMGFCDISLLGNLSFIVKTDWTSEGTPNPGWVNQIFFFQNLEFGFWDAGQIQLNVRARLWCEMGSQTEAEKTGEQKGKIRMMQVHGEKQKQRPRGLRERKKLNWFWKFHSFWSTSKSLEGPAILPALRCTHFLKLVSTIFNLTTLSNISGNFVDEKRSDGYPFLK